MNREQLMSLAGSFEGTRAVQVAVHMGLFEALKSEARTSKSVAQKTRSSIRGTKLLLNAITGLGLLKKDKNRFFLTPLSKKYLLKNSPNSYATMISFMEHVFTGYGELEKSVRSGRAIGKKNMFQDDPRMLEKFIGAMHDISVVRGDSKILAKKILNLQKYRSLLDIGGGPGTYSIDFCQANPGLRASVFDLRETLRVTRKLLKKNDTTGRVSVIKGNYKKGPLPKGFDVAFLSNIIHAENERDNLKLIKKVYQALNPRGLVIIKDHILNGALTHPSNGSLFALTMLLFTNGRCYSENEVKGWVKKAGFKKIRRIRTPSPMTSDLVLGEK